MMMTLLQIIFFSFDLDSNLNWKVFDHQEQDGDEYDDDEHEYVGLTKNYFLFSSKFLNDFSYFDDKHCHLYHHITNLMDTYSRRHRSLLDNYKTIK